MTGMKITAIVGSYHKGGMVDSAVDEILAIAAGAGADVRKFDLLDCRIEFCRNCQLCVQTAGETRAQCVIDDDMSGILDRIDASDAIVLASPMNFRSMTAIMKRFVERLIPYGYWPWSMNAPANRLRPGARRAIVVASSAAPAIMARYFTGMTRLLESVARLLGAGKVDVLFIGLARHTPTSTLPERARARARKLGARLVR